MIVHSETDFPISEVPNLYLVWTQTSTSKSFFKPGYTNTPGLAYLLILVYFPKVGKMIVAPVKVRF